MNRKNVMIAFGTRPEAIKMCPLVKELKAHEELCTRVYFTGQHRDMTRSVMSSFGVRPDFVSEVMSEGQALSPLMAKIMDKAHTLLKRERPDIVLVHGDTASAVAVAEAAFFEGIAVGHVEAGLRSGDMHAPFPEEYNRRAISLLADIHFAPTHHAAANLYDEGISASRVHITGNTVIDAMKYTVKNAYKHDILTKCKGKRIIFFTAHRRENRGETLHEIFGAVRDICERFPDVRVVFPLHPASEVKECAQKELGRCEGVLLTSAFGVLDCHNIMARSHIILTDSGGLQEEAAALSKPVLVMRGVTERPEGIMAGVARLAGTDRGQICATAAEVLGNEEVYRKMSTAPNPYGKGCACKHIAKALKEFL